MCECRPANSTRPCARARSTAALAAPAWTEKPNLESFCPVEMNSWVSGLTPGETRTMQGLRRRAVDLGQVHEVAAADLGVTALVHPVRDRVEGRGRPRRLS